jgi:hypothetical protein
MEFLDFEIQIGRGVDGEYPVAVLDSPGGEARGTLRLTLSPLELENRLQALQIALLRSATPRRRVDSTEQLAIQGFGQELFAALFHDDILTRFDVSLSEARHAEKGLRIKLRFDSAELSALPWEYLYDTRHGDYISRSWNTPLVRYIELSSPMEPLVVRPPLRILALVATPSDLPKLDVDHERERIELALAGLVEHGRVELEWLEETTWEALMRALLTGTWHIFHFVGHGGFDPEHDEGFIALTDETGKAHRLSATQLAALLGDHLPMRLALLNSCEGAKGGVADIFSSTAAAVVRRGTPAVVAMQYEITDAAAILFSRYFYTAVADGVAVDAAVSVARKGVWLSDAKSLEWGTPVLYMRARDGQLFKLEGGRSRDRTRSRSAEAARSRAPRARRNEAERVPARARAATLEEAGAAVLANELVGRGLAAARQFGQRAGAGARQPTAPSNPEPTPVIAPPAAKPGRVFCIECGAKLKAGNRYCNGCGCELS